jgi:hypothetical protein
MNVLEVMSLAISALTTKVKASTIANSFRHCKTRSMNNVALENLDQYSYDSVQQLHVLIKTLKNRDIMGTKYLLNYLEENRQL